MHFDRLVDDIYEAAVIPEQWFGVLDELARIADAEGTLLFAAAPGEPRWICSEQIRPQMQAWVDSPYYQNNPRGQHLVPKREVRFLTDLDAFTAEQLDHDPFYTEFLRPRGLGWCVGTSIHAPSGDTLVFSIEKAHERARCRRKSQLSSIHCGRILLARRCWRRTSASSGRARPSRR